MKLKLNYQIKKAKKKDLFKTFIIYRKLRDKIKIIIKKQNNRKL